jgi:hypothetical protein
MRCPRGKFETPDGSLFGIDTGTDCGGLAPSRQGCKRLL